MSAGEQGWRRRVCAAAAAVVVGLSGCTGEPDDTPTAPVFSPVPSGSDEPGGGASTAAGSGPAPSVGPSEAVAQAPALPEAATQQTPEGAVAFAQWWFDTLNYATATGDTASLAASSELDVCTTCAAFVADIDEVYARGGRIEGSQVVAAVDATAAGVEGGVISFPVRADVSSGVIFDSGEGREELAAEQLMLVAALIWRDDSWRIGDLVR